MKQQTTFDKINSWIRNSEASLVNLLSALAPWAAPVAPAFMSYLHMTTELGFPPSIALTVAGVVEVLGFSAISTIISFWTYNKRKVAEYKKAPMWLSVFSFLFYLAIVMTVNVALDAANLVSTGAVVTTADWTRIFTRGLLVLLSIPAGIILAVRVQHKELLDTIERDKTEAKEAKVARQASPVRTYAAEASYGKKSQFIDDVRSGRISPEVTAPEIASMYGISERTAFRWIKTIKGREQ